MPANQDEAGALGVESENRSRPWSKGQRSAAQKRFIEVAIGLIAEKGPDGFTFGDIAERAGCSRGLPGHYFTNKAHLASLAVSELLRWPNFNADRLGLEPMLTVIKNSLGAALRYPVRARALYVVLADAREAAPFGEVVASFHAQRRLAIRQYLEAGIEAGEISHAIDVDLTAGTIMATIRGAVLLALADPGSWDLAKVAEAYVDGLRKILAPPLAP